MKRTAFNLNLLFTLAFALLTVLAYVTETTAVTPFFFLCTVLFAMMQPFCSKTN